MLDFKQSETVLKVIGEATRLKILVALSEETLCLADLERRIQASQSSISQHVKKLKAVELITEERRGKWSYLSLNTNHVIYPILMEWLHLLPKEQVIHPIPLSI